MALVIRGAFEWLREKAEKNVEKHGVTFVEAMTVLTSNDVVEEEDKADPTRLITIGFSSHARILFVVTTEMTDDDRVRIISARPASPIQRKKFAARRRS
jgi:uncharacterized DUF497 family protein